MTVRSPLMANLDTPASITPTSHAPVRLVRGLSDARNHDTPPWVDGIMCCLGHRPEQVGGVPTWAHVGNVRTIHDAGPCMIPAEIYFSERAVGTAFRARPHVAVLA